MHKFMIKKIIDTKDNRLKALSKEVASIDKKVTELIGDLKDTLKAQLDPEGVGLAAPQIGKNFRVFVMLKGSELKAIINPRITRISKVTAAKKRRSPSVMEGCLSLPNFYTPLVRANDIEIEYLNEDGKRILETFKGLDAQIVQHEIDHLDGIIFLDRMFEQKKPLYEHVKGEWEEVEL